VAALKALSEMSSLRSNILAARIYRVPSKDGSGRLNLQWSLHPFQIGSFTGSLHPSTIWKRITLKEEGKEGKR
jgi:hypothetical protein